jgi:predicted transcriptional regulator
MDRSKVIQTLDTLPEVFETEALLEKLLFIDKVEKGMKDVAEGRTLSLQEVKQRFEKKWNNAK